MKIKNVPYKYKWKKCTFKMGWFFLYDSKIFLGFAYKRFYRFVVENA